ncbi:HAD-IC family P-type ATPase [Acholeplasma sp. OttesenSCG-928-E16]|nr:HAD-IC family P-type ATPase [Acholeplasma sp. OttesenSCG-928-E16]
MAEKKETPTTKKAATPKPTTTPKVEEVKKVVSKKEPNTKTLKENESVLVSKPTTSKKTTTKKEGEKVKEEIKPVENKKTTTKKATEATPKKTNETPVKEKKPAIKVDDKTIIKENKALDKEVAPKTTQVPLEASKNASKPKKQKIIKEVVQKEEVIEEPTLFDVPETKTTDVLVPFNDKGIDPLKVGKVKKQPKEKPPKPEDLVKRYNPEVTIGLTQDDVEDRVNANMVNYTKVGSTKSIGAILANNLLSFFNLLMVGIFVWQITVGANFMNLLFIIPVIFNIAFGLIQEINAKKTIDKLSILNAPVVHVLRDSEEQEITLSEIVIDDIILLSNGKQVPADCVVRNGMVEVNESLLTGESDAIIKRAGDILYSGSYIVSGYCQAQTTAVGKDIYINSLTEQAKVYKKPKSSLLSSIRILMVVIGVIIVPIGVFLFLSMYGGDTFIEKGTLNYAQTVIKVSGALVGMIPAGLILLTSISLSVGVIRLSQNKTLVQELYCIEMLARVDTLCLDKTGTITDGTMTVRGIIEYNNPTKLNIKQIIPAMINAQQDNNVTTAALIERFGTAKRITHSNIIPFSSSRKFSAVQFEKYGSFVIGAPEYVIKENYEIIARDVEKQALEGYRVIVVGYSPGAIIDNQKIEGKVIPLALIMIEDTIRADAIQTIQYFKDSNVDIRVISGDNPITASRVAARAGIKDADKFISLEGLSEKEVIRAAERYTVFGRVSPQQKKTLIQALKAQGRTVAMTGDGVNDILALREADCSIAMASGSEAATNVSHLVLLNSNFSSMPKVVSEGRRVINNVQKAATLFITKTLFSVVLSIIGIIKGYYPIETSQLLMIEYFIIAIPTFLISFESNDTHVKGNFLWNVIKKSLPGALVVAINSLIVYAFQDALNMDNYATSTLIVLAATFTCLGVLFNVCKPFNTLRKWLFAVAAIACLIASIAMPNLFNFRPFFDFPGYSGTEASIPLETPQILLLFCLIQAAYPLMYIISTIPTWIKNGVSWLLKKIGSME